MTKRTERAQQTQAKNGAGPAPGHLVEPMLAGMTTTRQHLLAWVHAHGLAALDELFREEAVALARAGAPPPRAADARRGSDVAVGRGVSRSGPADRADDAAAPRRRVDAPLRGQSRGAAEWTAHAGE